MGFISDIVEGVGDALGGVGDAVGGVVEGVADNPWTLSLATMPFGGIGGIIGGLGEAGLGAGMGMDMALNGAEFGADSISGLGAFGGASAYDGLGGMLMDADVMGGLDPTWGSMDAYSNPISGMGGFDPAGMASAVGSMSGGLGGLTNGLSRLLPRDKQGNLDWAKLAQMGALGMGALSSFTGIGRGPQFQQWSMPQAPAFKTASRSFDPTTRKFGQVQYYAGGGLANLPGAPRRPKIVSPHDKAVSALRSRYRSRKQAEEDAGIPGTVANKTLQGPGDPVLDEAFAYAKPKSRFAQGGLTQGPGDGMSDSIPAMIDNAQPAAIATDEYIIPADVVSHLGNGSSGAGGKALDDMVSRIRKARTGRSQQAPRINPNQFLK